MLKEALKLFFTTTGKRATNGQPTNYHYPLGEVPIDNIEGMQQNVDDILEKNGVYPIQCTMTTTGILNPYENESVT